jgi:hypothetical protein
VASHNNLTLQLQENRCRRSGNKNRAQNERIDMIGVHTVKFNEIGAVGDENSASPRERDWVMS